MVSFEDLFDHLSAAESVEAAVPALLRAVSESVREELQGRWGPDKAQVLRCLLFLRGERGWEGCFLAELNPGGMEGAPDLPSSNTAWASLVDHRQGLCLDVRARRISLVDGGQQRLEPQQVRSGTIDRLERVSVTHMLAMSLRLQGRSPTGMINVEIRCPSKAGDDLGLMKLAGGPLQRQVDLAALCLEVLPLDPSRFSRGRCRALEGP